MFKNGLDITNSLDNIADGKLLTVANVPDTIRMPVTKQWMGGQALGTRPPVTIRLLADGNTAYHFGGTPEVTDIVLDGVADGVETAAWQSVFENLPRVDDTGRPIAYTLQETLIGVDPVVGGKAGLYEVTLDQANYRVTNTYVSPLTAVYARKTWSGGPDADHTAPQMNLYQNGRLYASVPVVDPSGGTADTFDYVWEDLPLTDPYGQEYAYYADEAAVPNGYGKSVSGSGTQADPFLVTNTFSAALTDIAVQKDWVGGPVPRPEITLQLQRRLASQTTFQDVGLPVTLASGVHIHIWRQQPMSSQLGEAYLYQVLETVVGTEPVVAGIAGHYSVTTGGSWSEGLSVTNAYVPPKTQVYVSKQYINGDPATHVPVQVQLFRKAASGQKEYVGPAVELNGGNSWAHQWNLLDATNMRGEEYVYTVAELNQQPGYAVRITGAGTVSQPYVIQNTYGIPTGDITAYKRWVGGDTLSRPGGIHFQLYAGTSPAGGRVPLDGTDVTWTGLPLFNPNGSPIPYSVREVDADGNAWAHADYTTQTSGLSVTNTYRSPLISIYARKTWSGGLDADHTAPRMNLYQNGRLYASVPVVAPSSGTADTFDYVWEGLPLTDPYGQEYAYYADEAAVPNGYGKSVSGSGTQADPFLVTNTFSAALTDIAVQKDWVGGPVPRPEITLQLQRRLASQTTFQDVGLPVTLASGVHIHIWRQQPMSSQLGEAYLYQVLETVVGTEPVVAGIAGHYSVTTGGSWSEGLSVTNAYVPPKTQVYVSKQYINGDPATHVPVQVQLFRKAASGQKEYVGPAVELNGGNSWAHQWNLLDATNMRGEEYVYTVAELNQQPGYAVRITGAGTVSQPYVIQNTYGIPTGDITAYKRWVGGDTLSRPGGIHFQLYAGTSPAGGRVPLDGTDVTWTGLPLFNPNGSPIPYSVREVDADGNAWAHADYTTQTSGLSVTNTYRSPLISIYARKTWSGGLDADHTAPRMNLYQNGRLYASVPIVAPSSGVADVFDYRWDRLPETDAFGQPFNYSVREAGVPAGYVVSDMAGSGSAENLYHITNTFMDASSVAFTAFKQWTGGEDAGPRPDITLRLLRSAGGEAPQIVPALAGIVENPVTLASGTVEYTWENLPAFDEQRRPYTYSVEETMVGQTAVIGGRAGDYLAVNHGRYVSNTFDPPGRTVYARKVWNGGDAAGHTAPSLLLLRNGAPLSEADMAGVRVVVAPAQGTSDVFDYAYSGLPATDARGARYTYSIREADVPAGYTASDVNGSGTQPDPLVIVNSYLNPAELTVPATTQLIGADLQAGQFTFQLLDNEWNEVALVQNNADGIISFPSEIVSRGGRSVYLMRQMTRTGDGIEYDTAVYAVIVESVLDSENNYVLQVSYKKDGAAYSGTPLFVNRLALLPPGPTPTPPSYDAITVSLSAQKELHGGPLAEGQFKFVLKDAAGNPVSEVANQADGTVRFDPRRFSREGVYLYHLSEVQDGQTGVSYDGNTYVARVSVTDRGGGSLTASVRYLKNGEAYAGTPLFVNQYGTPETGDRALELPVLLLLASLALGLAGVSIKKRAGRKKTP